MRTLSIRLLSRDGFRESPWLDLAPGVTVLTGRNNVGKTRVLRAISRLTAVFEGRERAPVPEVRLTDASYTLEADVSGQPAPHRWVAERAGQPDFELGWSLDSNGNGMLDNARQPGSATSGAYAASTYAAQVGNVPLHTELYSALTTTVYFQPQRVPETVANTAPEGVPSPDAGNLGRVIYHHRGHETQTMTQIDNLISEMFPEIDRVLAGPSGPNQITVSVHDRYANQNVPLSETGTGVAQLLHLIASVLLMPAGRIMLVEEPTAYLHPSAEKLLASFIRAHPEHAYVISTHSPIFVSALDPDRVVLVRRDAGGIDASPVLGTDVTMRHVLQELGIEPGELALSERLMFLEGVADIGIYPVLMAKLGWDPASHSCGLIQLQGFGASRPVREIMAQLSEHIHVRHLVLLDGDQRPKVGELPNLAYLPVAEIENLFIRDPAAVRAGMAEVWQMEHAEAAPEAGVWEAGAIERYVSERSMKDADAKGSKILTDLAHALGFEYSKAVHGPVIAKYLDPEALSDLRPIFGALFD